MRLIYFRPTGLLAATGLLLSMMATAHATPPSNNLAFYLSKPQSQTTVFTNTTTETFDSRTTSDASTTLTTGNRTTDFVSAIGTYHLSSSSPFNIQVDNQYGSGTGNYMAIGAQASSSAPITLTFDTPRSYFGFSWNAGDANNGLTFYSGSTKIGRFSSADLLAKLSGSTVTALDNSVYNSSDYKGKPGSGATLADRSNNGEPYAFVNFIDSVGTFDKLVFDNSGTTGSGYETDNHTIRTTAPQADKSFVFVGTVSAPEPGSFALLLPGLLPLFVGAAKRRKIGS